MIDRYGKLMDQAVKAGWSDLYLLPTSAGYRIRGTINGMVDYVTHWATDAGQRLITYLKYRGNMAVSEHRRPQAGALTWPGPDDEIINVRLSTVGDFLDRESMVVRFIYSLVGGQYHFLNPSQWGELTTAVTHRGLFLFAGPMGSGKTTTMYRLAHRLANKQVVMTIEDPVEINEPRFLQLQVNELAGMTYAELLRVGLRHRPDVFIIGEIRDEQTAVMAIRAALSGHLVLATIHARDVYGVISRLRQLGIADSYLEAAVTGVAYQRLLPTIHNGSAVLFDLLTGKELGETLTKEQKVGMRDDWATALGQAQAKGQISRTTMDKFLEG